LIPSCTASRTYHLSFRSYAGLFTTNEKVINFIIYIASPKYNGLEA
ncbi:7479_t:CDS:1, partial [Scutellospora calospora]